MAETFHLTHVEIEGFKRFDHLVLDNIGQINVIIGDNNVGKTSLLEALAFEIPTTVSDVRFMSPQNGKSLILNKLLFYYYFSKNIKIFNIYNFINIMSKKKSFTIILTTPKWGPISAHFRYDLEENYIEEYLLSLDRQHVSHANYIVNDSFLYDYDNANEALRIIPFNAEYISNFDKIFVNFTQDSEKIRKKIIKSLTFL